MRLGCSWISRCTSGACAGSEAYKVDLGAKDFPLSGARARAASHCVPKHALFMLASEAACAAYCANEDQHLRTTFKPLEN